MLQLRRKLSSTQLLELARASPATPAQDRAIRDVANAPRTTLVVTNRLLLAIDLPRRAHAITPVIRRRRDDELRNTLETCDAMQTVANHLGLRCELCFVSELLKVTTTATTEVRTWRLNSHRRRRDDLFDRTQTARCPAPDRRARAARSPGAASETKTVFPPAWANPIPPGRIRSTSTSKLIAPDTDAAPTGAVVAVARIPVARLRAQT